MFLNRDKKKIHEHIKIFKIILLFILIKIVFNTFLFMYQIRIFFIVWWIKILLTPVFESHNTEYKLNLMKTL